MVIAKESFILYMKGTFLFEPWGQPHTTLFPHNWSEHTDYHILFPASIVTSHSPIPIFYFFSFAMKNNPPYFSRKTPKSSQNSKKPSETLPRQSLCFTELAEPTAASVTGIAAFSAPTRLQSPHLLCSLQFAHLKCLWSNSGVTSGRGRFSAQGTPSTALQLFQALYRSLAYGHFSGKRVAKQRWCCWASPSTQPGWGIGVTAITPARVMFAEHLCPRGLIMCPVKAASFPFRNVGFVGI